MAQISTKQFSEYTVIANEEIAPTVFCLKFNSAWLASNMKPGQFLNIKAADNTLTDPFLPIPLAVQDIEGCTLSVVYQVVGNGTRHLSQKKPQDRLMILGPLGNGFDFTTITQPQVTQALVIAGGLGIAPLFLVIKRLVSMQIKTEVFIGARTHFDVLFENKIKQLGVEVKVATVDGSEGDKGFIIEPLMQYLHSHISHNKAQHLMMYASGPEAMLRALASLARKENIAAQLSTEAYMACGFGVCHGCTIKTTDGYKLCCTDGPVFSGNNLE